MSSTRATSASGGPWKLLSLGAAIVGLAISALGCSGPSANAGPTADPRDGDDGSSPNEGDNEDPGSPGASSGPLGVVVIDVQKVFFDGAAAGNPKSNVAARMTNNKRIFDLAGAHDVPVFVTFEASKTGDHALPAELATALPAQAKTFIKTTFAATGQPQFAAAIKASGRRRFLVAGAETDVCVLQSVLGMRRAGFEVLAISDAMLTEEVNTRPTLRRMRQAGVVEVAMKDAEELLTKNAGSPAPATSTPPAIVRPLAIGILLHDLDGLSAADVNSAAKMVRLRELFLIAEWFRLPVFATDPERATSALPPSLSGILSRPIVALSERPSHVTQLAVAGGQAGIDKAVQSLKGDVFLVDDALVGGTTDDLEPLYAKGAVPTTYKTLYYELTQSVDDAEWPSQQWVIDGDKWFDRTKAPEDLPTLTP
jgi:nicotinamidase-related amidase